MPKIAKVAISLPESLLNDIERERKTRGESRSEFVRKAVENTLKHEKESSATKSYIQGYKKMPETPEEFRVMEKLGIAAMSGDHWE